MQNSLKEIRTNKGLTQQQLADLVQVSRQTIYAIESNLYTPSITLSLKIASTLKVKIDAIFILEKTDWE